MARKARRISTRSREWDVAARLHSTAIHLLRRLRERDLAAGIGPARLSALSVLVFAGPLTLGELAAAEQVRPPTMTRIVAGLVRVGHARIQRDAHDRRACLVSATVEGRRVLQAGRRRRIAFLVEHFRALNRREVATLDRGARILQRMLRQTH